MIASILYSVRLMRWSVTRPCGKVVGADALGAVAAADQALARRGDLGVLLALLHVLDARGQHRQACALFLCCERPSWHSTTMPVGRWVMRTAESVLLMCWPPAPEARKVSMRISAGLICTSSSSSASGITATVHAEVWMRPLRLGLRHALHAMAARLELELRIDAVPMMRAMTSL
jgi:hypothetical protein